MSEKSASRTTTSINVPPPNHVMVLDGQGWVGLIDIGRVALAVTGFLLPFAVPAALVAVLTRWWLRRRRDAIAAAKSRI